MISEASEAEDDVFSDAQEARNSHSGRSSPIPKMKVEKVNSNTPSVFLSVRLITARPRIETDARVSKTSWLAQQTFPYRRPLLKRLILHLQVMEIFRALPRTQKGRQTLSQMSSCEQVSAMKPQLMMTVVAADLPTFQFLGQLSQEWILSQAMERFQAPMPLTCGKETQSLTLLRRKATYQVSERTYCLVLSSEPMTESDRSKLPTPKRTNPPIEDASPIAADGGFGPMSYEESEDESVESKHDEAGNDTDTNAGEAFGDDFDDFEAGAENEDFGDFDEGFEQPPIVDEAPAETHPPTRSSQSLPPLASPFVSKLPLAIRLVLAPYHLHCSVYY